jgi:hypothetical protein
MRRMLLVALAACESQLHAQALPPLVVAPHAVQAAGALHVVPGEQLIWEVAAGEITIGRAELVVRDAEIASRFATSALASMFATVRDELVTTLQDGKPVAMREQLVVDGETRDVAEKIDAGVHTPHSALAWLRAWTPADHAPATLAILHGGHRYRVVCEAPVPDALHDIKALRIACQLAGDDPIAITVWLEDDRDRVPLRIVARAGTIHLAAELVSRENRGSAATPVAPAHGR